jgi:hypothetical protein
MQFGLKAFARNQQIEQTLYIAIAFMVAEHWRGRGHVQLSKIIKRRRLVSEHIAVHKRNRDD